MEQHLRKEQAGFHKQDLINILRIILEQSVEWQAILYVTFIDFEKVFDCEERSNVAHTAGIWYTKEDYSNN